MRNVWCKLSENIHLFWAALVGGASVCLIR